MVIISEKAYLYWCGLDCFVMTDLQVSSTFMYAWMDGGKEGRDGCTDVRTHFRAHIPYIYTHTCVCVCGCVCVCLPSVCLPSVCLPSVCLCVYICACVCVCLCLPACLSVCLHVVCMSVVRTYVYIH